MKNSHPKNRKCLKECKCKIKNPHNLFCLGNGDIFIFGGERMDKMFFIGGFIITLTVVLITEKALEKTTSKSNG